MLSELNCPYEINPVYPNLEDTQGDFKSFKGHCDDSVCTNSLRIPHSPKQESESNENY